MLPCGISFRISHETEGLSVTIPRLVPVTKKAGGGEGEAGFPHVVGNLLYEVLNSAEVKKGLCECSGNHLVAITTTSPRTPRIVEADFCLREHTLLENLKLVLRSEGLKPVGQCACTRLSPLKV